MKNFKEDLVELLDEHRFAPFVITSHDGFAIAVETPRKTLLGNRMLVVLDSKGAIFHFPFTSIAHISEPEDKS